MAANNNHLERRVPVGEDVRDRLRTELAGYAYGSVMLDGATIDQHSSAIVNNPYYLVYEDKAQQVVVQTEPLETLF